MALEDELQAVMRAQEDRYMGPGMVGTAIDEIRSSLLFQYDPNKLVLPAFVALNCIGACYLAGSSNSLRRGPLEAPPSGFRYIQ